MQQQLKKLKFLLTGLLCVTLSIPSIHIGAFTINRHSPESEDTSDMEESSSLDTKEEEVEKEIKEDTEDNIITLITCVENMPELRRCIKAIQTN